MRPGIGSRAPRRDSTTGQGSESPREKTRNRAMQPPGIGSKGPTTAYEDEHRNTREQELMEPPGIGSKGPKTKKKTETNTEASSSQRLWNPQELVPRGPKARQRGGPGGRKVKGGAKNTPRNSFQGAQKARLGSEIK